VYFVLQSAAVINNIVFFTLFINGVQKKFTWRKHLENRHKEDRRELERMLCYIDVFDQASGDLIGSANDIHQAGLNLITKEELPLLNDLSIWIEYPGDNVRIPLVIEGVWNQMQKHPVYYSTGCKVQISASMNNHILNEFIVKIKNITKNKSKLFSSYTSII
jgi:hypothetical protein